MKKISLLLLSIVIGLSACDMDKKPYSSMEENEAVKTINDCRKFRNGLYTSWRGLSTGGYLIYTEIQLDDFHGVTGNGNRLGTLYTGSLQTSTDETTAVWAGYYSVIASANFIINKMENMENTNEYSDEDLKTLRHYLGEALVTRAFCYYNLIDKFCAAYSESNKTTEALGVPLVTVYAPTSIYEKYPGRSTLEQSYKLITDDLANAIQYLEEYEAYDSKSAPVAMSNYITSDAAKALQARVALAMKDYQTALNISEKLIASNRYPLVTMDKFAEMWTDDNGSEILFQVHMDETYRGSATGSSFLSNESMVDYIPTANVVMLYDDEDVRGSTFLLPKEITTTGGTQEVYTFGKFAGNMKLQTGATPEYRNMGKPFRSAELYLIAAEAASQITGGEVKANQYLNDLMEARIEGYTRSSYTGTALFKKIQEERHKELIGEGFRFGDLKRWNLGFKRTGAYPSYDDLIIQTTGKQDELQYDASDHRFLWPIPKNEIDANPQIEKQQNPGY